ncbi:MAG: cyclic-di-AMP receptor [Anaerolineae bacterium]|nr:cyclic-di-AMP receptor [Anaerolineae bacterium]
MKMVMAVIHRDQADLVLENLINAGYGATFTESRGGMLRQAQKMVFTAVNAADLKAVLNIIKSHCRTKVAVGSHEEPEAGDAISPGPTSVVTELGGAVVFVWELDTFETY